MSVLWVAISMVVVLAGCVAKNAPVKTDEKPVFFPPPPEPPRYQFLTAFRGTEDFEDASSGLDLLLGSAKQKGYRLKKPSGVVMVGPALYVGDTQSSVWKFDLERKQVQPIQGDKGPGKLLQPVNVARDEAGNKYVSDPLRGAVVKFDKNDFYVRDYKIEDKWKPVDAAVYGGKLYAVDSTQKTGGVKVFDLESGALLETIGRSGPPDQQVGIPTNIAIDKDGNLFVMDTGRFQIMKFDRDGYYRGSLGGPGSSPGFFGRPRGIDLDRDGRIYAVDAAHDVVQIFAPNGQVLMILGGPGSNPGTLTLPAGVHVSYEHVDLFQKYAAPGFEIEYLVIVTSQFHNTNAVSVYGFGKMSGMSYQSDRELLELLKEDQQKKQAAELKSSKPAADPKGAKSVPANKGR